MSELNSNDTAVVAEARSTVACMDTTVETVHQTRNSELRLLIEHALPFSTVSRSHDHAHEISFVTV